MHRTVGQDKKLFASIQAGDSVTVDCGRFQSYGETGPRDHTSTGKAVERTAAGWLLTSGDGRGGKAVATEANFISMRRSPRNVDRSAQEKDRKECQVCGRFIKAKTGVLAHHGYQRPEPYYQTDSCYGARTKPYSEGREAIPKAVAPIQAFVEYRSAYLARVVAGVVRVPGLYRDSPMAAPGDPDYEGRRTEEERHVRHQIRSAEKDLATLQARYDRWYPGIVTPRKGRPR